MRDPSGGVTITLSFTAQNPGLMELNVILNLKSLLTDDAIIAECSDSRRISPGSSGELSVSLHVSPEDAATFEGLSPHYLTYSLNVGHSSISLGRHSG